MGQFSGVHGRTYYVVSIHEVVPAFDSNRDRIWGSLKDHILARKASCGFWTLGRRRRKNGGKLRLTLRSVRPARPHPDRTWHCLWRAPIEAQPYETTQIVSNCVRVNIENRSHSSGPGYLSVAPRQTASTPWRRYQA